jgi:hypothetical protein
MAIVATDYQCTALETLLINRTAFQGCMLAVLQGFLAIMPRMDCVNVKLTKTFWTCYSVFFWATMAVNLFGIESNELHPEVTSLALLYQALLIIFLPCWWFHPHDLNMNGYIGVGDSAIEV